MSVGLTAPALFAEAFATPAWADGKPLSYLHGFGAKAVPVVALTWGVIWISIVVVVIISALVVVGISRRRAPDPIEPVSAIPITRSGSAIGWLYWGVGVSTLALFGTLIWTVVVLADVNNPGVKPAVTIEIAGHQWWWSARYLSDDPSRVLTTANEIHIPVGQPIRVKLIGADVIHSFWVPALAGKTDTIPGQTNTTWIEADRPGRYMGQCTEYCGEQHAHMAFIVVAEPKSDFEKWQRAQLLPAKAPDTPEAMRGERSFEFHCGACHTVRGTDAGGTVAPDLTHLMSRETLAAGAVPNTVGNLAGWVANPQAVKPGTLMPTLYLAGSELSDIGAYLKTLN
ncbi:MAG TPA: cytochrome c oxidase subunit II [Alphaproteobacteria bacterium]|nr:cytochrome c oxidase subunit II [Alphaproteobacteria bacterium]